MIDLGEQMNLVHSTQEQITFPTDEKEFHCKGKRQVLQQWDVLIICAVIWSLPWLGYQNPEPFCKKNGTNGDRDLANSCFSWDLYSAKWLIACLPLRNTPVQVQQTVAFSRTPPHRQCPHPEVTCSTSNRNTQYIPCVQCLWLSEQQSFTKANNCF